MDKPIIANQRQFTPPKYDDAVIEMLNTIENDSMQEVGLKLANAVTAAVSGTRCEFAGATLEQLIHAFHRLGIALNDDISSIEFGVSRYGGGWIMAERDEYGRWEIREVSK